MRYSANTELRSQTKSACLLSRCLIFWVCPEPVHLHVLHGCSFLWDPEMQVMSGLNFIYLWYTSDPTAETCGLKSQNYLIQSKRSSVLFFYFQILLLMIYWNYSQGATLESFLLSFATPMLHACDVDSWKDNTVFSPWLKQNRYICFQYRCKMNMTQNSS